MGRGGEMSSNFGDSPALTQFQRQHFFSTTLRSVSSACRPIASVDWRNSDCHPVKHAIDFREFRVFDSVDHDIGSKFWLSPSVDRQESTGGPVPILFHLADDSVKSQNCGNLTRQKMDKSDCQLRQCERLFFIELEMILEKFRSSFFSLSATQTLIHISGCRACIHGLF